MNRRNSYCNSGPGGSAYNGNGWLGPSALIITGGMLQPEHQLRNP